MAINREMAAYLLLVVFAIATRFWDLGSRALHHDESLHAVYAWYLYIGKGYTHDPMMHGPFQFEGVALIYLLFGASDFTVRILAALTGVWLVISPYFLRKEMGRLGALVASSLFAISPSFLYFSRFAREAIYIAGFEMLIVIGLFGFLRERRNLYLYLFSVGVAFAYATKETVFITGLVFLMFFLVEAGVSRLTGRAPAGWSALRAISPRGWAVSVAIFLTINVLMYTTFFTNPKGLVTGTVGAISYWLSQHGVERGGQPWFYYLLLIPLYELLPLAASMGAFVFLSVRRQLSRLGLFTWFMVFWFLGTLVAYSWAGEKMPWLDLHITEPLMLLGALAIAGLLKQAELRILIRQPGLTVLAVAGGLAALFFGAMAAAPPIGDTHLDLQSAELQQVARWLLGLLLLAALAVIGRRHGLRAVLLPTGMVLLAVLLLLTIRTAWGVAYERADTPRDMLVYVQTSPDVPRVVREIERISFLTGVGKDMKILLDGGYADQTGQHESIAWPFEWYLRDYKARSYYSKTLPTPTDAPVILAMAANEDPIRDSLSNYVSVRGRLNWWYPEDYKTLTWGKIWEGLLDPSTKTKVWRYFLYKETLNPLGSRDFDLLVRSDLARGIGLRPGAPAAAAPRQGSDLAPISDAVAQAAPGGISIWGKTNTGGSILTRPRDVAIGPNGLLYVVDSAASRVFAFRLDGTVAYEWGRKGDGDGEFNEPWGIAVAPSGEVYVADTWNHRVQKFDDLGRFMARWGIFADAKGQLGVQPGGFWGPRDATIAPNGEVLVTDTGNKRVQRFDAKGRFLGMFGGDGSEPGKMSEPVGIVVDSGGNIYVADTWNRRIQKLDSEGQPVVQFAVAGWDSQSVTNKPFLAVDQDGRIYYTEPEKHRFVVLGPSGHQEGSRGVFGAEPSSFNVPTGIAVSPKGELFIGDGQNSRVVKYGSWR